MNYKLRTKRGLTLMEMTVVVAIVALLAVFGLPAIRAFVNSLESKGPAEAMISAALSSARAIAVKEQRYAGIRFQEAYDPKGPLDAAQYMIFIKNETNRDLSGGNLANGFRAVEGIEPIKLPDAVGVMDLRVRTNTAPATPGNDTAKDTTDQPIQPTDFGVPARITDTTSFSIIFSPSGKLVIHEVRVRNRDGKTTGTETTTVSQDDVFNTLTKITNPTDPHGMFVQDDYSELGLGAEFSRNSFVIYDRVKFATMDNTARFNYLQSLNTIYINPYTGTIIEQD
jgi:prepilin-type N-terminal cleavage/methylation domain-containing protein